MEEEEERRWRRRRGWRWRRRGWWRRRGGGGGGGDGGDEMEINVIVPKERPVVYRTERSTTCQIKTVVLFWNVVEQKMY